MSTLHAALMELADEWEAEDSTDAPTGDRTAELRNLLAAHPAPEAGEVRLTEEEREALRVALTSARVEDAPKRLIYDADIPHVIHCLTPTIERIIAARLAEVAQPAGETRVEWAVVDQGKVIHIAGATCPADVMASAHGHGTHGPVGLARRTKTVIYSEWEVAGDE